MVRKAWAIGTLRHCCHFRNDVGCRGLSQVAVTLFVGSGMAARPHKGGLTGHDQKRSNCFQSVLILKHRR